MCHLRYSKLSLLYAMSSRMISADLDLGVFNLSLLQISEWSIGLQLTDVDGEGRSLGGKISGGRGRPLPIY